MQKPGNPVTTINKGANGAVTATQTSAKINAGGYNSAVVYLDITAISGASAGLAVQFQDSPDGVEWTNVPNGSISSQTAVGETRLQLSAIGPYLQAIQTVVGTTPSITYDLKIAGNS
jgi:hypothetical protein